jgi:hypothetical protein
MAYQAASCWNSEEDNDCPKMEKLREGYVLSVEVLLGFIGLIMEKITDQQYFMDPRIKMVTFVGP